jgi:hypothetical protein
LRVDLAQTGAAPTRISNTATMRTMLQRFVRFGFHCCGNRLTSTRPFFSTIETCLAFATGQKNRPTGLAVQILEGAARKRHRHDSPESEERACSPRGLFAPSGACASGVFRSTAGFGGDELPGWVGTWRHSCQRPDRRTESRQLVFEEFGVDPSAGQGARVASAARMQSGCAPQPFRRK